MEALEMDVDGCVWKTVKHLHISSERPQEMRTWKPFVR